jgi:hypothetical protein
MRAILAMAMAILFSAAVYGGDAQDPSTRTNVKKSDLPAMLGAPTADSTFDGLHVRVWLITQKRHAELMAGRMSQMTMQEEREVSPGKMEMRGMSDTSKMMGMGMKGMKHEGQGMSGSMLDSMTTGTHHIVVDVADALPGKDVVTSGVGVLTVSPSNKRTSLDLTAMKHHFGGALTLDEKGVYLLTLDMNVAGILRTTQLRYAVK